MRPAATVDSERLTMLLCRKRDFAEWPIRLPDSSLMGSTRPDCDGKCANAFFFFTLDNEAVNLEPIRNQKVLI